MPDGDRQSDGERSRAAESLPTSVARREHDEHQDERDDGLDDERLDRPDRAVAARGRRTETGHQSPAERLQHQRSADRPDTLGTNVQRRPKRVDAPGDEKPGGDGRVDVAAADVRDRPDDGADGQAERQRDVGDGATGRRRAARAARDQDQQERADELGQDGQPECGRLQLAKTVNDRHGG